MSKEYDLKDALLKLIEGKRIVPIGTGVPGIKYIRLFDNMIIDQDDCVATHALQCWEFQEYTPPKEEDVFNMQFMQAIEKHKEGWKVGLMYDHGELHLIEEEGHLFWYRGKLGGYLSIEDFQSNKWRTFGKWENDNE